jgi:hypothetical protein
LVKTVFHSTLVAVQKNEMNNNTVPVAADDFPLLRNLAKPSPIGIFKASTATIARDAVNRGDRELVELDSRTAGTWTMAAIVKKIQR